MSSDDVDRAPPGRGSAPTTPPGATSEPWLRIGTPDLHELRQAHGRKIPLDAVSVQLYVEADLALGDGDRVVYEEPSFGIAELARALQRWRGDGTEPGEDFALDSMDWAELGVVSVTRTPDGWAWGSCLVAGATTPVPWTTARRVVDTFVAEARAVTVRMVVDAGWTPEEARAASARVLGAMGPSD